MAHTITVTETVTRTTTLDKAGTRALAMYAADSHTDSSVLAAVVAECEKRIAKKRAHTQNAYVADLEIAVALIRVIQRRNGDS